MSTFQRSLEIDNDVPLLENEEEASTVESVIERELEDDEIDVEIQRVSQIKDESKIDLGKKCFKLFSKILPLFRTKTNFFRCVLFI